MAIRYDKQLNREVARIVKNYNAKINRATTAGMANVPDRITVSALKASVKNRRELRRELRRLSYLSERNALEEIQVGEWQGTRYAYKSFQMDRRRARNNLRREIREINIIRDPNQARSKDDYLANIEYRYEALRVPIRKAPKSQLRMQMKIIERDYSREERDAFFYKNFFKMLFRTAYTTGVSPEVMVPLLDRLRQYTPYELTLFVENNGVFRAFLTQYKWLFGIEHPEEEEKDAEEDLRTWLGYMNDTLDANPPRIKVRR